MLSFTPTRGLMTGQWSAWSKASVEDADNALGRLRDSNIELLNAIYAALIRMIGSARAAYTSVLFPVVALLISTLVENYQWSVQAVAGIGFIIAGNWLALTRIERK